MTVGQVWIGRQPPLYTMQAFYILEIQAADWEWGRWKEAGNWPHRD